MQCDVAFDNARGRRVRGEDAARVAAIVTSEWSSDTWNNATQSRRSALVDRTEAVHAGLEGKVDDAIQWREQEFKVELGLEAPRSDTQGAPKHGAFGPARRDSTAPRQGKGRRNVGSVEGNCERGSAVAMELKMAPWGKLGDAEAVNVQLAGGVVAQQRQARASWTPDRPAAAVRHGTLSRPWARSGLAGGDCVGQKPGVVRWWCAPPACRRSSCSVPSLTSQPSQSTQISKRWRQAERCSPRPTPLLASAHLKMERPGNPGCG